MKTATVMPLAASYNTPIAAITARTRKMIIPSVGNAEFVNGCTKAQ
jgi:hypothetical protein